MENERRNDSYGKKKSQICEGIPTGGRSFRSSERSYLRGDILKRAVASELVARSQN